MEFAGHRYRTVEILHIHHTINQILKLKFVVLQPKNNFLLNSKLVNFFLQNKNFKTFSAVYKILNKKIDFFEITNKL